MQTYKLSIWSIAFIWREWWF